MILYINELPNEIIEDNSNNETTLYIKLKKKNRGKIQNNGVWSANHHIAWSLDVAVLLRRIWICGQYSKLLLIDL